ncbi:ATP-binding protein [Clostridium gasigenes]|uniref:Histidine kinase-, DNA gyrase B-, and HSP90-like ATPase n=1 Tax=Clostridium gasigenes TaxID=94869 RepID=A0A1H0S1V7_9CLOT|nr:ATP-binding protein [Clostridium gasigenes]SDP35703.1 Histidine kinase-, DNA gyrase B-, and HSP90-like ATPase [Clostridium gasigenes]
MEKIQIGTSGVKKSLNKYTPTKSLVEYIWNGFDAKATIINIEYDLNEMDTVVGIRIKDNGYGISKTKLSEKFKPFYESQKEINPDEVRDRSAVHGKNGIGRLTFFKFAEKAIWTTVYEEEGKKYKYDIEIEKNNLEGYRADKEIETEEETGTIVTFIGIDEFSTVNEIKDCIAKEFCWFLELNDKRGYEILIHKEIIDYSHLIEKTVLAEYEFGSINFYVKYVVWKEKLNNEYSKYYFINSSSQETMKENTSLNNKGDKFYHSVYITSNIFDEFHKNKDKNQIPLIGYSYVSSEFIFIKEKVEKQLKNIRRPFIERYTNKIIEEFEKEDIFPRYDRTNMLDNFKKTEIESMVKSLYKAQPQIFNGLNKQQKKTFVRFLDLIMQSGETDNLFNILDEIIDLDCEERAELSDILKKTKLSNVIKTMKLIEDRYKAVEQLKELVFNKELGANEVKHIQGFIESHYWLFGEQYHLVTAAEPKFKEALKRYHYMLTGEVKDFEIEHPDKNREMDIFAVREEINTDTKKCIVVELKHPRIKLGYKEIIQVKKYMNVIQSQEEFIGDNILWEFILVGNSFDTSGAIKGEIESNKYHGERSLVHNANRCKIYVKTWSEIFTEFEIKHNFLNEKLKLERQGLMLNNNSADDILEDAKNNNTAIQPKEIIVKQVN